MVLLAVLHSLVAETNLDGSLTARGIEIWQQHSVGDNAWFTVVSDHPAHD
jgi:hypothetical protein